MDLRAVILDMDGTITRFNIDYLRARRLVLEELEKMKLKTADMTEQFSIYLLLKQLKPRLDPETYGRLRKLFYSRLEEMEIKAAREVMLYPGVFDTMNKLRGRELLIGLVTNNGRKGTNLTLKRLGLKNFFDAIVTRDDCE
ncbi:MAG TPA: HAD hydrolase-like protein, partial [Candidatus Bathyarchaeia archaeon]|nr:HAD hydrolase-like protein [Candidatus Bathyarchaeia archaeon]